MPSGPATRFGRSPTWGPSTVIKPCLLPRGLKWPPAEPKSGGIAPTYLVDVESVAARRELRHLDRDHHSVRSLHEYRPPDHLALRVAELGLGGQQVHLSRNEPARYLGARLGARRCFRAGHVGRADKQHASGDERKGLRARGPFRASVPEA